MQYQRILIIQTAFIGDVVLATPVIEKLYEYFPDASIDFVLRKGNENLLSHHPKLRKVYVWNKKEAKIKDLFRIIREIRNEKYELVINLQRFFATGLMTILSGTKKSIGYRKNPLSFFYQQRFDHHIGDGTHEVTRNLSLIRSITDDQIVSPKLYLSEEIKKSVKAYTTPPYITIAPTSVWYTKQFPAHKWIDFIKTAQFQGAIYLLGGPADETACEEIRSNSRCPNVINLCGKLSLLESTALMEQAQMNYVNDSAPQHFASAVNAPVTAVFCSTVPSFGFGPLSTQSYVVEYSKKLSCRPCGLHGHRQCPEGHFNCAEKIETSQLINTLTQ